MRMLLAAAATGSLALILAGFGGARTSEPGIRPVPVMTPTQPADDASSTLSLLGRQPALEPHRFANECFMAAAYKRYQIPAAALDDAYATAGRLDPYFVDMVYVATDQRCPGTDAARTEQSASSVQAIQ